VSGHRFRARLGDAKERPLVELPADVVAALGARVRIPVAGTINGTPYRTSTMPMGGGRNAIGFRTELREAAGVAIGDTVEIVIDRDDAPRVVEVPDELAAALDAEPALRAAFDAMSYTHRREWAESVRDAKRPETKQRRIDATLEALRQRL
jgi:hypothetical protein